MSSTASIPKEAMIALLNREIEFVRFLNKSGKSDTLRAAAANRVLALQKELDAVKSDNTTEGDPA